MTCPFKMANCGNHQLNPEDYPGQIECTWHLWDFCTDPIDPEKFTAISKELRTESNE